MIVSSSRSRALSLPFVVFLVGFSLHADESAAAPTPVSAKSSGLCLAPKGSSAAQGTSIIQSTCDGSSKQQWDLVPTGNHYHFVNRSSGLCLNVAGNSTANGTEIIQWTCQKADQLNDQWGLVPTRTGFRIQSRSSGKCVNITGGSLAVGAAAIQWGCQELAALNDQFDIAGVDAPAALPSA